jgi:hypothetical protein
VHLIILLPCTLNHIYFLQSPGHLYIYFVSASWVGHKQIFMTRKIVHNTIQCVIYTVPALCQHHQSSINVKTPTKNPSGNNTRSLATTVCCVQVWVRDGPARAESMSITGRGRAVQFLDPVYVHSWPWPPRVQLGKLTKWRGAGGPRLLVPGRLVA